MENKSIKCRYITPLEWEQTNKKGNYFDNSVKIINDGYETYCCSETIIDSLVEHVNDGTLTSSQKQTTNNGKMNQYTFVDKTNKINYIIKIPTELKKYDFIRNDIKQLDKLCDTTNKIRNHTIIKNVSKRAIAAVVGAVTLVGSYAVTTKIKKELTKPAPSTEHQTYNNYYGNIMREEKFNENVERLSEIAEKYEKQKQKTLKK